MSKKLDAAVAELAELGFTAENTAAYLMSYATEVAQYHGADVEAAKAWGEEMAANRRELLGRQPYPGEGVM